MANEEEPSSGKSRYVSRYIGALVGTVLGAGAGVARACEKAVRDRRAEISEDVAAKVPEPALERAAPEPSDEAKAKVEEAKPETPETS